MMLVNWKLRILWNTEKSYSSLLNDYSVIYFLWIILIQNGVVTSIELFAVNLLFPVGMRRKGLKPFLLRTLVALIIVLVHSISKDIKTKPIRLGIIKAQGQFPRLLSGTKGLTLRVRVRLYTGIGIEIWLMSQVKGQHKPLWSKWKNSTSRANKPREVGPEEQVVESKRAFSLFSPSPNAHHTWRQLLIDGDCEGLVVFWLLYDSISIRRFFLI